MTSRLAAALAATVLAGCVTPGVQTDFQNSAVITRDEPRVWADLIDYFTRNNIQIRTIERDSGVIYAERARFDPELASCTSDPSLSNITGIVTMNVFVRPLNSSQTQVTVNTDFGQSGTYGGTTFPLTCYSTGLLEADVLRAVGASVVIASQ